jgi:hypothetical protein
MTARFSNIWLLRGTQGRGEFNPVFMRFWVLHEGFFHLSSQYRVSVLCSLPGMNKNFAVISLRGLRAHLYPAMPGWHTFGFVCVDTRRSFWSDREEIFFAHSQ